MRNRAYHTCKVLEDRKVHLVHQVCLAKEDCKEKKDHLEEMDREFCQDLKDLLDHQVQREARHMALPEQQGYDSKSFHLLTVLAKCTEHGLGRAIHASCMDKEILPSTT
jgi:hypothetical protein